MVSKLAKLGALIILAAALVLIHTFFYKSIYIEKIAMTAIALAFSYLIFRVIMEGRYIKRLEDYKNRYYYSKAFFIIYLLVVLILTIAIWVQDIQALVVSFGLIAAAFTITIQDVARNFVGGISIFINRIFTVGDRIELNDKRGDVIDIGLLYTTLMEIGDWVNGDLPTGRLSMVPNGYVLGNTVNNYTKDFGFIWEEMMIPVTYDSDWKEASSLIMGAIRQETGDLIEQSKKAIPLLERKYFFSGRSTEPAIFLRLTDNWIEFGARFVTDPWRRRMIRQNISRKILEGVEGSDKVRIASQTFDIVGFPELKFKNGHEKS